MHKLGNDSMTANDKRNEIKAVLTARRNLYNAGVALLECDNVYASNIKFALERLTFSSHTVPFVGAGSVKKQIDETDIMLYLETFMRIYWCCTIKVDIGNSKGQYIGKDKQEATKDGSESTKIQHGI